MTDPAGTAVEAGIRQWVQAFNAADLEVLLALYSEQAVLVPTTVPQPLSGAAAVRAYFERVMARRPRLLARLHEPLVVRAQIDWALCSGRYDFREGDSETAAWRPARFSFCWRQEGALWRIADHHSSFAPS
ncbi:MAG: SgcJ/EcaC family oxidoreductase [Burkholderiales bacterium]|nr:MAG: SgcJ/EcaC family oxidoreductase [Burkholderiales bacterium]